MKNKIVIWGEDAADQKVLITLELKEFENNVLIHVFPQEMATEELYSSLMNDWKNDKPVDFPEGAKVIERPLSVSESLLPDELKTDKSDILTRAQAEWHFTVLSSKLYQMYKSELDEYKDKIDALSEYSEEMWTEMKNFWEKVQNQVRERNMFRDHAATLKERTNNLFDKLKELRKELKKELEAESQKLAQKFNKEIDDIEEKVEKGLALKPVFDELKDVQGRFFKEKFTRKDKDSLWKRIDNLFKKVKELKYGDKGGKGNKSGSRLKSRYEGLLKAINRMQNSINYDKKDVDFQNNKINTTDGQLEMQIRQAKLVMIEERLKSKQAKLQDMLKTKGELEKALEKEKQREEQRKLDIEKEKAKEEIKKKIAEEIKSNHSDLQEKEDDLVKAAEAIKEAKRPQPKASKMKENEEEKINKIDEIKESIKQTIEDVTDTVAAVSEVIEDKIDDFVDKIKSEEE